MVFDLGQKKASGRARLGARNRGRSPYGSRFCPCLLVDRDDDVEFASLRRQPSHLEGMPTRKESLLNI